MTVRTPRRAALAAAAFGLAVVGVAGTVAVATGGSGPEEAAPEKTAPEETAQAAPSSARSCAIPDSGGDLWVDPDAWDRVAARLENALAARFGHESKTTPRTQLFNGLIGRTLDYAAEEFVVVADPAQVDLAELQSELEANARSETRVRVQAGCHTGKELADAARVLDARTWHPRVRQISYSTRLDPRTSTFLVTMPAGEVADALEARLGELVTITYGTPTRG
jgi:hypothetical protein